MPIDRLNLWTTKRLDFHDFRGGIDFMSNVMYALCRFIGFTMKGWLCAVLPVFIILWVVITNRFAKAYTVELALVLAIVYAFFQLFSSVSAGQDSIDVYRHRVDDKRLSGIFALVALGLLVLSTGYGVHHRNEAENLQAQLALKRLEEQDERTRVELARIAALPKPEPMSQLDSYCMDMGVKYGRGAARGMRGLMVAPNDDIEIPVECRNLDSTSTGIRLGTKLGMSR